MTTSLNLSNSCQSKMFFGDIKSKALEKLIDFSKEHTNLTRSIGLPLALCSSLLDLAQAVSTIGELLIKGIANIFGSPFSEKCKCLNGVKQIFAQLPGNIVYTGLTWPLNTAGDLLYTPIAMLFYPTSVLEYKHRQAEGEKELMNIIANDREYTLSETNPIITAISHFIISTLKQLYT